MKLCTYRRPDDTIAHGRVEEEDGSAFVVELGEGDLSAAPGKWADGSAPVGPWLVTADEVPDPQALGLRLEVNGLMRQESSTREMIPTVAELLSFASRLCTLRRGDILLTGTPSGVRAATSTYLGDGDLMAAEVECLGRLETPVQIHRATRRREQDVTR